MDYSDPEDEYIAIAQRKAKQAFLKEEIID